MNKMRFHKDDKVILTDCDGVLLNWEYSFHVWMSQKGYDRKSSIEYDLIHHYDVDKPEIKKLIREFNESAAIGFLPPLRDAMYYVDLLHRKHGYVFHMITSLSKDPNAQKLRIMNTKKIFGETAFEKFVFLDTGEDKDEELAKYKNSGYIWIEDKIENAETGLKFGLNSVLMEHGHNMNHVNSDIHIVKNWEQLYHEAA